MRARALIEMILVEIVPLLKPNRMYFCEQIRQIFQQIFWRGTFCSCVDGEIDVLENY